MRTIRSNVTRVLSCVVMSFAIFTAASASAGVFEVDSRSEARLMKNKIHASQFLSRATFGPTMAQIDTLATRMNQVGIRRACDEWIDAQFALPVTEHLPITRAMYTADGHTSEVDDVWIQRYRYHSWWHTAITADDQLRQRMAWALSQILVTSEEGEGFGDRNTGDFSGEGRWLGPTDYYDTLVRNAFGNYRTLLQEVTYHPVMGVYLSYVRNRKTNGVRFPDENYAREVMQLFSIGLYELHQDGRLKTDLAGNLIPTYDNETIKEFAKVFTGLTYRPESTGNNNQTFYSGNDLVYPMVMAAHEHDMEPKTLLNGVVVDTNNGDGDIAAALDNIFDHENVAPFISYRLIQRFVKSNPSRGYIRRVAMTFDDNGSGVKGDLKAVIKAILLDPEAWRSLRVRTMRNPDRVAVTPRGTEYSRLREPVIRYAAMLRGFNATSTDPNGYVKMLPMDYDWTQAPYKSPSVFNFYLPSYQPSGELIGFQPSRRIPNGNLVAPEFQQKTAVTSNRLINRYTWDLDTGQSRHNAGTYLACDMVFDLAADRALVNDDDLPNNTSEAQRRAVAAQSDLVTLVDKYDLLFCAGTMPQDFKDELVFQTMDRTDWMIGNTGGTPPWQTRTGELRVSSMLLVILTSPFAAIEE